MLAPHLDVDDAHIAAIAEHVRPVAYEAGQTIYAHGSVCTDLVLLSEGIVRAYYIHEGRDVNLRLLCAPAAVTAMRSLVTGEPSEEWVEAITPVRGFKANLDRFARSGNGPLGDRLRRVLAEQHYLALERRLHMLQWKSVAERYAYFLAHADPVIVAATPGYHVASYLGVAAETLSRARKASRLDDRQ